MNTKGHGKVLSLVQLALFTAIILALAFTPGLGYIPLGVTRATTIHLPVIIGSIQMCIRDRPGPVHRRGSTGRRGSPRTGGFLGYRRPSRGP